MGPRTLHVAASRIPFPAAFSLDKGRGTEPPAQSAAVTETQEREQRKRNRSRFSERGCSAAFARTLSLPKFYAALRTIPQSGSSYVSPVPVPYVSMRPVGDVSPTGIVFTRTFRAA